MTPSTENAIRVALNDRMRGRDLVEVARAARVHRRTLRRLLEGPTFGPATVRKVARVLRVDLDQVIADSARTQMPTDAERSGKVPKGAEEVSPIVGWKAAAEVLGVHRDTLRAARRAAGDQRKPWWSSAKACAAWFDGLAVTGW